MFKAKDRKRFVSDVSQENVSGFGGEGKMDTAERR